VSSLAGRDFDEYRRRFERDFKGIFTLKPFGDPLKVPLKIRTISPQWKDWLVEQGYLEYRPDAPVTVLGDPEEVQAAISNLIDNAVKYSGKEVRVRVETVNTEDKHVSVRVHDQGPGIPKAELKQIFKRFYRSDKAGTTRGFGLGLPIAKGIVELYRGSIEVESKPKKGSTFRISLPMT